MTTFEIKLERLLDTPVETAFAHWTEPEHRERWCAPDPAWIAEAETDLRVGGAWKVTFGPSREELYRAGGVFEVVDRPHRLVHTSVFHYPDGRAVETRTTVTFEDQGGKTLLTFVEDGYPSEEERSTFLAGSTAVLEAFARAVEPAHRSDGATTS